MADENKKALLRKCIVYIIAYLHIFKMEDIWVTNEH